MNPYKEPIQTFTVNPITVTASVATVQALTIGPTTPVLLADIKDGRKNIVVYNNDGVLYVKLGSAPTSAVFSYRLKADTFVEIKGFGGAVYGIKQSGTSGVLITEY